MKKNYGKLREWEELPRRLQTPEIKSYYKVLKKKTWQLKVKRVFDEVLSVILIVLLAPVMLFIAVLVYKDSGKPIFFRQARVTQYGKKFEIYKFRTMIQNAEQLGAAVTGAGDSRVTSIGVFLRKTRLDELPQLFNIITGDMTFVGTRPEVPEYVKWYTKEMQATLLLPAGVTSLASIKFKDEAELLKNAGTEEKVYTEEILPEKMRWNLKYLREFSLLMDLKLMLQTVLAVWK